MALKITISLPKHLVDKYIEIKSKYKPSEIFRFGLEYIEKKEEIEKAFKDNEILQIKELLKNVSEELKIVYDIKNDFMKLDKNVSILNDLYNRVIELSKLKDELFQLNVAIIQTMNKIKEDPEIFRDRLYSFYKEVTDTLRKNNVSPQILEQIVLLYRKYRNVSNADVSKGL